MPVGDLVQTLLRAQQLIINNGIVISGSKTVTLGNTIVVASTCGSVGGLYTAADNLGNTYIRIGEVTGNTTSGEADMTLGVLVAEVTNPGTLTAISISWTNLTTTRQSALSVEFEGNLTAFGTGAGFHPSGTGTTVGGAVAPSNGFWLFAAGIGSDTGAAEYHDPTGFSRAWEQNAGSGIPGSTSSRTTVLSYFNGNPGTTIQATLDNPTWRVGFGGLLIPEAIRPDLVGISFDGVTIR